MRTPQDAWRDTRRRIVGFQPLVADQRTMTPG
jgi:hypothetical protein